MLLLVCPYLASFSSIASYYIPGSPGSEHSSSPIPSRKDIEKLSGDKQRKGDDRDLGRDSGRGQYSHSGVSYKDFDRYMSKSSHHYNEHDEYNRRDTDKNVDDYDRDYSKLSSRRGQDLGDHHSSSYSRHKNRPRDYPCDTDKYSRYKSDGSGHRCRDKEEDLFDRDRDRNRHKRDRDGKIDHQRSSRDLRNDRSPAYEDLRGLRNNSSSRRDCSGLHLKEAAKRDTEELDGEKYNKEEKKIHEDQDRYKERHYRDQQENLKTGRLSPAKLKSPLLRNRRHIAWVLQKMVSFNMSSSYKMITAVENMKVGSIHGIVGAQFSFLELKYMNSFVYHPLAIYGFVIP